MLAVTRLSDGVCVAGITRAGKWIRPTRPAPTSWWPARRQIQEDDCRNENDDWVVRKGNVVDMELCEPIAEPTHPEDWLLGDRPPTLVRKLSDQEYRRVCSRLAERNPRRLFVTSSPRSLMMIEPDEVVSFDFAVERGEGSKSKYRPRLTFRASGRLYRGKTVTDAEWRGYGREVMKKHGDPCRVDAEDIFRELGAEKCWLSIGKYEMDARPFLLVIGIHLFPVQRLTMDFRR